ncbi:MAG: hypothetical protein KA004_15235 [Verrucomicrobiales bacterium]|nr:hypothetical protein [Verrucomicrobiales bacterium]
MHLRVCLFHHLTCLALLVRVTAADPFAELVRPTDPFPAEEEAKKFHLPPGFSIQLIASEPVINKPMNLALDDKGRLWVSSSAEYPWAVPRTKWRTPEGDLESSRDKIVVFSDSNGDGIPDKPTVFADNLNIPNGLLPHGNGCIVWSIPNIWRLEDTDGDGMCDKRTVLFGPLGWEQDTHGNLSSFRLAPDGWIYATHGFSNTTHLEVRPEHRKAPAPAQRKPTPNSENWKLGPDNLDFGYSLDLNSGNVFRFKPDGSRVEIWAWGQVNPFGLAWDRWGNLYSADCHSNPLTQIIREAYYPSFGKPDGGLGFGPVLCEHSHGSTGICGPLYLDRGIWGAEYDDRMLVCNPVTSRINQDKITYSGATPKANELPDFLTTDDPWFRPVDIRLAGDGSMYVADFYNKIIGHYEVPLTHPGRDRERGRIWRVAKEGVTGKLRDLNEAETLGRQWRFQPGNPVAIAAQLALAAKSGELDRRVLRLAVEAAAASPRAESIPVLLKLKAAADGDPSLLHTAEIALRNTLRLPGAVQQLGEPRANDTTSRSLAKLVRNLNTPEAAAWLLAYLRADAADPDDLAGTLASIATILPAAQAGQLAALARERFEKNPAAQLPLFQAIRSGLARRGETPPADLIAWGTELVDRILTEKPTAEPEWKPGGDALTLWKVEKRDCADGRDMDCLTSLPAPRGGNVEEMTGTLLSRAFACPPTLTFWLCGHRGAPNRPAHQENFVRLLSADDGHEIQRAYPPRNDRAVQMAWDLKPWAGRSVRLELVDGDSGAGYAWLAAGRFQPEVVQIQEAPASSLGLVAEVIRDLKLNRLAPKLASLFSKPETDDAARSSIAKALAVFPDEARLLGDLFKSSPTRWQLLLAESMAGSKEGAAQLCVLASPRLLAQPSISRKLAALKDPALNARVSSLTKNLPPAGEEADRLIAARIKGFAAARPDAAAGERVFLLHCSICHKIDGKGTLVGPQLDGVGNRGAERLCEDILDPNRAVDPAFHLRLIKLHSGAVLTGLQRRVEGETIVFADATGKESTVAKADIAANEESPFSLMPAAFDQSIPEADFYNLLAWLLSRNAAEK